MKKIFLATAVVFSALASTTASAQVAGYAGKYDGKVKFEGEVIDQTCIIKTGTNEQTVTLDKVQATKLDVAGKVAGGKNFSIELEGCKTDSLNQLVRVEFRTSPNVDTVTYTLKNLEEGQPTYASNVNLRLNEVNGTPIQIGNAVYRGQQYQPLNGLANGAMQYSVEYYAIGQATVGKVKSEVEYSIV